MTAFGLADAPILRKERMGPNVAQPARWPSRLSQTNMIVGLFQLRLVIHLAYFEHPGNVTQRHDKVRDRSLSSDEHGTPVHAATALPCCNPMRGGYGVARGEWTLSRLRRTSSGAMVAWILNG
jgi:hypothetical protein